MDKIDKRILDHLYENGRDKISAISAKLGIPRATIFERIRKMKEEEVIRKFTVMVDYEKLGMNVQAYVLITFNTRSGTDQRTLSLNLARMSNVISVSIISGDWDIMMHVVAQNMRDLSSMVLEKLRNMDGVERTQTLTIFESVK